MSKTHPQPPLSSAATTTGGTSSPSPSSPAGGSTSPATVLNVQPEKPQHYTYLKEFRTEQCPLFVQHKCTQHRPFSCFHWHFLNQRRRRPIRRRDGTFNYSPDVYCTKYDEGTGTCPDGDECPFLHRTAGDTERRYHLRYYKTGSCIHETDAKGHCSKNGSHCAFAHGSHDLRSPVYDIRLQVMESQGGPGATEGGGGDGQSGQAASTALIEKILSEEPRWQENNYVLSHYKTELCKKPPRLCRQGYACPYYHNSKDRRRSPHKHKYRSLPCPAVKQSEEWGDPSKCEGAEGCQYCHTRTEQQFHPEIYKSTKCNDMQQCGSCPRGPFCAFAHVEKPFVPDEPSFPTPGSPPPPRPPDPLPAQEASSSPSRHSMGPGPGLGALSDPFSPSAGSCVQEQGLLGSVLSLCEDVSGGAEPLSPWAVEGGYCRAPGFEREDQSSLKLFLRPVLQIPSPMISLLQDLLVFLPVGSPLSLSSSIPSSLAATPPSPAPLGLHGSSISSGMNANALPFYPTSETVESVVESALDDLDLNDFGVSALEKSLESSSTLPGVGVVLGGSQFQSSAPVNIPGSFSSSAPFSSPSPSPPIRPQPSPFFSTHLPQPGQSENTFLGPSHSSLGLNGMSTNIWEHFPSGQGSPGTPPTLLPSGSCAESSRLKQELEEAHRALKQWGHSWRHTAQVGSEAPHTYCCISCATRIPSFCCITAFESILCSVVYRKQRQCCVTCGEPGSVSLSCGHGLQCETCSTSTECPLCPEQTLEQPLS
uniref:Unk zinc finger n=1 Tax=Labrus bergylta TaxID=56723 RepID=A0A3Q3GMR3_9LABR